MRTFKVLVLLLAGCGGTLDPMEDPITPIPPAPVNCVLTPNDVKQSIGLGGCGSNGEILSFRGERCYRCYGEFTEEAPVAPQGCIVFPQLPDVKGLCVNSCTQCGSSFDEH